MKFTEIKSCYIGPNIPPEQFISEHFFLFIAKGKLNGYDGNLHSTLKAGESCIVQKNSLVRYNKEKEDNQFEKIVIIFDKYFLMNFQKKNSNIIQKFHCTNSFIKLEETFLISNFIVSLHPYFTSSGKISDVFSDLKREELLLIILQIHPELSGLFFNFENPDKINIEEFMLRNYKFNVSLERFAFLTGRSLSTFKRNFKESFNETPSRWLTKKRLEESRFLIEEKNMKPADFFMDLGFEDLSHFYFAFKNHFGISPGKLKNQKKS
ncbi:AraC family transcriptional regulator [Chryseobacterium bernardetii]|uniref:helix-turn-helix domain-containing protein n=1 Tax=Chryseobacterium bernardetii TaxID=1241978 RepID=UPI0016241D9B|nr:helix-turn-helix domain-containing protein [Chryseobacterium bernardetii]